MVGAEAESDRWGTWEDLILGGAVLRHGTQAWNAVASELQARTLYPFSFTPEACKTRFEDLRQRYSGCRAWFEELRKRRVADLRRELEKSEDSIGCLESKLESLKAATGDCSNGCSFSDAPRPVIKLERVESSGKDTFKDELSAGSFTHDIRKNWSPRCHITASAAEMDRKPEISENSEPEKFSRIKKLEETTHTSNDEGETLRKKRGNRKRKDCSRKCKEWTIEVGENLRSADVETSSNCKENSTSGCTPTIVKSSSISNHDRGYSAAGNDLMEIFCSITANENASIFRHRLDSQKRARYRKTVRRHMDLDTIRARIGSCSIVSVKELFRDLLILANNALVFYSKRTHEYKKAVLVRDMVTKAYHQHCRHHSSTTPPPREASPVFPLSSISNRPVKPRSVRPYNRKLPSRPPDHGSPVFGGAGEIPSKKAVSPESVASGEVVGSKQANISGASVESLMKKERKAGKNGRACKQMDKEPVKERKRIRRR